MTIKASEVYLRAAELIDSGAGTRWSCCAIDDVQGRDVFAPWSLASKKYLRAISPDGKSETLQSAFTDCDNPRAVRVLALLFMHQIALDEEGGK